MQALFPTSAVDILDNDHWPISVSGPSLDTE